MFVTTNPRISSRLYSASGARRPIRSVSDLKGGRVGIATFGSSIDFQLAALLHRHGLTINDVELVVTGSIPSAFAALESGKVDAAGFSVQVGLTYERRHPQAAILIDLATAEGARRTIGVDSYPLGLIADPDWLERNRHTARHVANAYKTCYRWVAEHAPEEIRNATPVERRSSQSAADMDDWKIMKGNICPDGRMPVNAPEQVHTCSQQRCRPCVISISLKPGLTSLSTKPINQPRYHPVVPYPETRIANDLSRRV
jgi:hypothetical protein